MSKLGENIKKYRTSKGLTQEQLANILGYKSKSAVANWELGHNSPTDDKIEMMLDIFEVDANTLFGWDNAAQIKSDAEELANLIRELLTTYSHSFVEVEASWSIVATYQVYPSSKGSSYPDSTKII